LRRAVGRTGPGAAPATKVLARHAPRLLRSQATEHTDRATRGDDPMATLPLKALWIGEAPIEFSGGSSLDTELQDLVVVSLEVRLPYGVGENYPVRVELANGRV
jgi:hypothetical protein